MYTLNNSTKRLINVGSRKVLGKLLCFFSAHVNERDNASLKESLKLYLNNLLPTEKRLVKLLMVVYKYNCLAFAQDVLHLQVPEKFRYVNLLQHTEEKIDQENSIVDVYDYLSQKPEDLAKKYKTLLHRQHTFKQTLLGSTVARLNVLENKINVYDLIRYFQESEELDYEFYNIANMNYLAKEQYGLQTNWDVDGNVELHFESYSAMEWKIIAKKLKSYVRLCIEMKKNSISLGQ